MCLWVHCLRALLHHQPGVVPPLWGCPAFPVREAIVRGDVEGVGAHLRRGSRLASGAWCRPRLGWRGDERVCPGEVRDPYPPLVRLVVVEPPDPHVDEFVLGTLSLAEERLKLPHADVGSFMWVEGRCGAPVGADIVEVRPEGVYQVVRGRAVVDAYALGSPSRPMRSPECGG